MNQVKKAKVKIKKGDEVIVIAGKDKGRRGAVLQVKHYKNGHVKLLVEGVNMVKKHVKPNPNIQEPGGIKEREAFMDISNVMLYDSTTKKGGKVGFRALENDRKVRYFRASGEVVHGGEG